MNKRHWGGHNCFTEYWLSWMNQILAFYDSAGIWCHHHGMHVWFWRWTLVVWSDQMVNGPDNIADMRVRYTLIYGTTQSLSNKYVLLWSLGSGTCMSSISIPHLWKQSQLNNTLHEWQKNLCKSVSYKKCNDNAKVENSRPIFAFCIMTVN